MEPTSDQNFSQLQWVEVGDQRWAYELRDADRAIARFSWSDSLGSAAQASSDVVSLRFQNVGLWKRRLLVWDGNVDDFANPIATFVVEPDGAGTLAGLSTGSYHWDKTNAWQREDGRGAVVFKDEGVVEVQPALPLTLDLIVLLTLGQYFVSLQLFSDGFVFTF